jgi:hypothetical protein
MRIAALAAAIAVSAYGCATTDDGSKFAAETRMVAESLGGEGDAEEAKKVDAAEGDALVMELRLKVVDTAKALIGVKYNSAGVVVNGQSFTIDCIGTIRAAFWGAGIDIAQDFYRYSGNGVSCLYQGLEAHGALKTGKVPEVGDVVFWDNTWDRNGDGVFGNDPLTHAGIIVQVDEDGTCHYLHASVHAGVTIERMNLHRPSVWKDESGKVINNGLYLGSYFGNPRNPAKWTAGDLFRAFGDATEMIRAYGPDV